MSQSDYELVVGLEVHAQLATQSKAFCSDANRYGSVPNSHIGPVSLAYPGTLPVPNREAIRCGIKMGLACGCEISRYNTFDRKNYFYPDLPKGFQLTQDKNPICKGGAVRIRYKDGRQESFALNRIHLEEDAGKSVHLPNDQATLVDLNRAGVPLIEIVTEPVIHSAEAAYWVLHSIRQTVRYLEICDGNMEEGSLRCDANISVRKKGAHQLGQKVEVKNMNSMRNVQRAIEYEFVRQVALCAKGEKIASETRLFNADNGKTYSMRNKEELNDYRYFPEPDLPPFHVTATLLNEIEGEMPILPQVYFEEFTNKMGLSAYDADLLTEQKETAEYFKEICRFTANYKAAANWLNTQVRSYLNDTGSSLSTFPLTPQQIAELIGLVDSKKVSHSAASGKLFSAQLQSPEIPALKLAEDLQLLQVSDQGTLRTAIQEVLGEWPDKVAAYQKGKKNLLGLFMGEVMKKTKGKADPKKTNELLKELLNA